MAKEGQTAPGGLDGIAGAVKTASGKGPPPVHLWNPAYCGEIDMRIAADGTWFYQKTPIGRPAGAVCLNQSTAARTSSTS